MEMYKTTFLWLMKEFLDNESRGIELERTQNECTLKNREEFFRET